jgi:hypothetical protein
LQPPDKKFFFWQVSPRRANSNPIIYNVWDRKKFSNRFFLLSLYQSFPGTDFRIIGAGEVIQGILVDEPGVMNLVRRQIALTA